MKKPNRAALDHALRVMRGKAGLLATAMPLPTAPELEAELKSVAHADLVKIADEAIRLAIERQQRLIEMHANLMAFRAEDNALSKATTDFLLSLPNLFVETAKEAQKNIISKRAKEARAAGTNSEKTLRRQEEVAQAKVLFLRRLNNEGELWKGMPRDEDFAYFLLGKFPKLTSVGGIVRRFAAWRKEIGVSRRPKKSN